MAHIGYKRVSTTDQNTDRQLAEIKLDETFTDQLSGKDTNRPELQACLKYCRKGDTLHIHSLDRLARNLRDLKDIVTDLTSKGVAVIFHKEAMTFEAGKLNAMNKMLFQVLGSFAEFERSLIKERQAEGIAIAKEAGKYKGRKRQVDRQPILKALDAGTSKAQVCRDFGISRSYVYKIMREEAS